MPAGSGLGGLVTALLPLVGLVTILRARAARKKGDPPVDEKVQRRQDAARDSERRMAAYLDSRESRNWRDDGGEG